MRTLGFDGGYVRARRGPERNFEVVVGKVLADGDATRFAFVRQGSGPAGPLVKEAMVQGGYGNGTEVMVLSDGDAFSM